MANCVITSGTNHIRFDFNDQSTKAGAQVMIIHKARFYMYKDSGNGVKLDGIGMRLCTLVDPAVIKVDTVNAVAITDVDDLITKLEALL